MRIPSTTWTPAAVPGAQRSAISTATAISTSWWANPMASSTITSTVTAPHHAAAEACATSQTTCSRRVTVSLALPVTSATSARQAILDRRATSVERAATRQKQPRGLPTRAALLGAGGAGACATTGSPGLGIARASQTSLATTVAKVDVRLVRSRAPSRTGRSTRPSASRVRRGPIKVWSATDRRASSVRRPARRRRRVRRAATCAARDPTSRLLRRVLCAATTP